MRPSLAEPALYQRVNVEGTVNVLEAARKNGVKKVTIASSSSVYGLNSRVPFRESDPIFSAISPYAASKLACEALGHTWHHIYKMDVAMLRFFTVYGPRQRPDLAIYKFAKLITAGKPIPVFGDGSAARDYTFVTDTLDGIIACTKKEFGFEIFNLGESETVSLSRMIELLEAALGKKAVIDRQPLQPGDVPITFADISKARAKLGYNPQVKFEHGHQTVCRVVQKKPDPTAQRWRGGRKSGSGALVFSAAAFSLLNAERNSQCRFNPCTKSSVSTTILETLLKMFELACTCALRLLVMSARLMSSAVRFVSVCPSSAARFVSVWPSSALTFVSEPCNCSLPFVPSAQTSGPPGSRNCRADDGKIRDHRPRLDESDVQIRGRDCGVVQHGGNFVGQRENVRHRRLHLQNHRLQLVGNRRRLHRAQPGGVAVGREIDVAMHPVVPRSDNAACN